MNEPMDSFKRAIVMIVLGALVAGIVAALVVYTDPGTRPAGSHLEHMP